MTCPGMNTDVDVIVGISPLQTQSHHLCHPLTVIIIFIVFFFFVIIIITGAIGCGFATMDMTMHGLHIGAEVAQAAGADKAKLVVHDSQVIHHYSLILTLFAAPGAEDQATSSLQGLYGP